MATQHTPGPWVVSAVTRTEVIGPKQRTICRAHRDAPTRGEDETRANAHLIAAAPELYAALAHLCDLPMGALSQQEPWTIAHSALRKARGETA